MSKTYPVHPCLNSKLRNLCNVYRYYDFISVVFFFADRATVLEEYDKFWTGVTLKLTANSGLVDRGDPPTVRTWRLIIQ